MKEYEKNKKIFAENLRKYIDASGKTRHQLADEWEIPYSTLTEWCNARKYPRIASIEKIAKSFRILKSDLIEDDTNMNEKKNSLTARAVLRMQKDDVFYETVEKIYSLTAAQLESLKAFLDTFK